MSVKPRGRYEGPPLKVVYFDVAAKAECIRLALAYAGVEFTDLRMTFAEFNALKAKGELAFGQVPCVIVGHDQDPNRKVLVQTAAILRYVGKITAGLTEYPLYPSDPLLAAAVDAIVDQDTDLMLGFTVSRYAERFGFGDVIQADADAPPEKRARLSDVTTRLHNEVFPRHLSVLSALLAESKTGWLTGSDGPTIADFMLVPTLQRLRGRTDGQAGPPLGQGDGLSAGLIERHPSLVALIEKLMALPQIQKWYAKRGQTVTYSHVPRIGFGTFNNLVGDPLQNRDDSLDKAVTAAIDAGYRHFDCAELYCNEGSIGTALATAQKSGKVTRSDLFLVSKVWNNHHNPVAMREACERTLKALGTDYLDLYLIHWPVSWTRESVSDMVKPNGKGDGVDVQAGAPDPRGEVEALAEAWRGMEALVDAGLVRQIGVSNYGVKRLRRVLESCRIRPACNQVECHPHLAQRELLAYCRENNVDLVAYHPIGKPTHRKEGESVAISEPCILAIAKRLGCTAVQVILAWHLSRGVVVIPKSCTASRITENYQAAKIILSAEDVAAIDKLENRSRFCTPSWLPSWD